MQKNSAVEIQIYDGELRLTDISKNRIFVSDENTVTENQLHHVVFTMDGAAKIATIVIDGILSDGSVETRSYGWGRIFPYLKDLNDTNICVFDEEFDGTIHHMRVYNRALRTSEAIANFNAGLQE